MLGGVQATMLGMQRGGFSYLLETDFTQVSGQPVTLANGQVLDTQGEGIVSGSITVRDVEGSHITINSNMLNISGQSSPADGELGFIGAGVASAIGRVLKFSLNVTSATQASDIGFFSTNNILFASRYRGVVVVNNSGNPLLQFTADYATIMSVSYNTEYKIAIILGDATTKVVIKGGSLPDWTLKYTYNAAIQATVYPSVAVYDGGLVSQYIKVTDTLFPDLLGASPDYSILELI